MELRKLTRDEIDLVSGGGDTIWVTDIWIVGGEEMWVVKEMYRADGESGYQWTGNWCRTVDRTLE